MDSYDEAPYYEPISDAPIPIPRAPHALRWSGWLFGAILGVIASLWTFPAVRYTLTAQMEFALAGDSVPWISNLDADRTARERPRLDIVAEQYPDDYLMQVGRATALAATGVSRPAHSSSERSEDLARDDKTAGRLAAITRLFPRTPGAYAHLARYLIADRVRIQRAELRAPNAPGDREPQTTETTTPDRRNVKIMLWALNSGERLDPDNAFWPAMLATTYIAANQDDNALKALERASTKHHWDAYIYEEVLGQWRLYSAAYGDYGATQKIGPLSLVIFPHLYEIRRMAEMARWHAERLARLDRNLDAAKIRHNLAHLGMNLRDNTSWALEALYGTHIFFIACTDIDSKLTPNQIRTPSQWELQAVSYHKLLHSVRHEIEYRLMHGEVEVCCELRKRVDLARYDASYPGIPPGIPLMPLFGNWMGGICLVQQALGLLLALGVIWLWQRINSRDSRYRASRRTAALLVVVAGALVTGSLLLTTMATPRIAGIFIIGATLLTIIGLEFIWRRMRATRSDPLTHEEDDEGIGGYGPAMRMEAREGVDEVSTRWTHGTTLRMLVFIVLPYLAILYSQRNELSGLHPVAILLTSLLGVPRAAGLRDAMEFALLASALPLALPLGCGFWGLYRGISPFSCALTGLRRLALPCMVCLVVAYAVLLNRTLILDAQASQAIQKAAQNDRQWVLTHGAENPF